DGIHCEGKKITGIAGGLRQSQRRIAQGQVGEEEISAQSQVLIAIASYAGGGHVASACDEGARGAAVYVSAEADVVAPVLIVARLRFPPRGGFFIRGLLTFVGRLRGRLLRRGRSGRCGWRLF